MSNPFGLSGDGFTIEGRAVSAIYFYAAAQCLVRVEANGKIAIEHDLKPEHMYCRETKILTAEEMYSVMSALFFAADFARENGIGKLDHDHVHFQHGS